MNPSAEEFARWRDDSVTRWVFAALQRNIAECEEAWRQASWLKGQADPLLLTELRTRADANDGLLSASYEGFCQTNGDEPRHDEG